MLIPFRSNYALVSMILLIKHHCYILNPLSYMHPSIKTSFAPPRETAVVLACSAKFGKICEFLEKKKAKISAIFNENFEIRERCKGVHCVDLGESFPTSSYLQKSASIQPRTSLVKFARSPCTHPPKLNLFLRLQLLTLCLRPIAGGVLFRVAP